MGIRHLALRAARGVGLAILMAATSQAQAQSLGVLPATFKGDLPCADCTAIQYQLDLFADNSYDLLLIYRGKSGRGNIETGQWSIARDTKNLVLQSGRNTTQWVIENTNSLRKLNLDGTPIVSNLSYTLKRDAQTPNAVLTDTPWRLTRLLDQPARGFENQREPQIVMRSDGTVAGSDGCNRLTGGYRHAGASLTFAQMASTRMACMNGMEQAARFTGALSNAATYRITGRHLELFDAAEAPLMRFEAVLAR